MGRIWLLSLALIVTWLPSMADAQPADSVATAPTGGASADSLLRRIESLENRVRDLTEAVRRDSSRIEDEEHRLDELEKELTQNPEMPMSDKLDERFPGSFPIPGTSARLRIGGFVKAVAAYNFDPIGSVDRFITALIPPEGTAPPRADTRASFTADQSRLLVDFREPFRDKRLRAYIEGDLTGTNNVFRLRHAYGEYSTMLAGQTWSVFTDQLAVPEDVDFEGLNSRTRLRQTQARFSPRLGQKFDLKIAIEDPKSEVSGATGVAGLPDLTASINRDIFLGHLRFSTLLRQIRARADSASDEVVSTAGWGVSFSGQVPTQGKDNFQYQINFGNGIGRYINDLDEAGEQDAVYDAANDRLDALLALGFYVSYQHWWSNKVRSTGIFGLVTVDNQDTQEASAYRRTYRVTGNLLWSPVHRIDLGGELLWGERANRDGSKGSAVQAQLAAKYKF